MMRIIGLKNTASKVAVAAVSRHFFYLAKSGDICDLQFVVLE